MSFQSLCSPNKCVLYDINVLLPKQKNPKVARRTSRVVAGQWNRHGRNVAELEKDKNYAGNINNGQKQVSSPSNSQPDVHYGETVNINFEDDT